MGLGEPKYPIVPKFSEKYSAFHIFCDNEMDEVWLRNVLGIEKMKDYKTERVKPSYVITAKDFQKIWEER